MGRKKSMAVYLKLSTASGFIHLISCSDTEKVSIVCKKIFTYINEPAERISNKTKVTKHITFGFQSFSKSENRILFSCNTVQN